MTAGKVQPLLDNARYILRKLSHARSSKLQHHPATRQVLLLGVVRYPLDLVPVTVGDGRHGDRVRGFGSNGYGVVGMYASLVRSALRSDCGF